MDGRALRAPDIEQMQDFRRRREGDLAAAMVGAVHLVLLLSLAAAAVLVGEQDPQVRVEQVVLRRVRHRRFVGCGRREVSLAAEDITVVGQAD